MKLLLLLALIGIASIPAASALHSTGIDVSDMTREERRAVFDHEHPTLRTCPWPDSFNFGNGYHDINLALHDDSGFSTIDYTVGGNTYDLLAALNSDNDMTIYLTQGEWDTHLRVVDNSRNLNEEDRDYFSPTINITGDTAVISLNIYLYDNQQDTYACTGIEDGNTFSFPFQAAYAEPTNKITLNMQVGDITTLDDPVIIPEPDPTPIPDPVIPTPDPVIIPDPVIPTPEPTPIPEPDPLPTPEPEPATNPRLILTGPDMDGNITVTWERVDTDDMYEAYIITAVSPQIAYGTHGIAFDTDTYTLTNMPEALYLVHVTYLDPNYSKNMMPIE